MSKRQKKLKKDWQIQSIERMQNELLYLRQEVEFLKKIINSANIFIMLIKSDAEIGKW